MCDKIMSAQCSGAVCVVPGCHYRKKVDGKQQSVHKIPKKPLYRSKWMEKIKCLNLYKLSDTEITRKGLFVCPRHFKTECYLPKKINGSSLLKTDALPTEFLPEKILDSLCENNINIIEDENSPRVRTLLQAENSPSRGKITPIKINTEISEIRLSSISIEYVSILLYIYIYIHYLFSFFQNNNFSKCKSFL